MASIKKSGNVFKNAKIIWLGVAILLVFVFVGTLQLLRSVYQTETYYVLNQDVASRTQITMDMLTPVVTSKGTAPGGSPDMTTEAKDSEREAILASVQSGTAYSQYPLVSGDVLSPSNVGSLSDISVGVPDSWVVTSFSVNYNNAVQGRISRGTYFDIMVVSDSGSYYPFVNVLCLETSTSSATPSESATDPSGQNAETSVYAVGLSPENAAKLQWLMSYSSGTVQLVLSPRQNEYQAPDLDSYQGIFYYDPLTDGVIAPGLQEVTTADGKTITREVTDYTFSDVERDQFGRPVSSVENYGLGNAKISADDADGKTATEDDSSTSSTDNNGTSTGSGSSTSGTTGTTSDSTTSNGSTEDSSSLSDGE